MHHAKKLIDSLVEAKGEEASVTVTLTGSSRSVQKALKHLARDKKGKPLADLAKSAGGGVNVKATGATPKVGDGDDDDDDKPKDKGDKPKGGSRFQRREKPKGDDKPKDDGDED